MSLPRRAPAIVALALASLCAQAPQPPRASELALRARVKQFYSLLVAEKYRAAERLVAPASRDIYYAQEKPLLKDFAITGLQWERGFQKADVTIKTTVKMRRAMMGEFEVSVPSASHWTLEHGLWMWYIPQVTERSTPFGTMHVDEALAKKSGLDIDAMIAKGPKAEELLNGVKVNPSRVSIPAGLGNSATTTVENSLPGVVHVYTQAVSTTGVAAKLSKRDLGLGDKAQLTISRIGPPVKGSVIYVRVEPTGQSIPVTVE